MAAVAYSFSAYRRNREEERRIIAEAEAAAYGGDQDRPAALQHDTAGDAAEDGGAPARATVGGKHHERVRAPVRRGAVASDDLGGYPGRSPHLDRKPVYPFT